MSQSFDRTLAETKLFWCEKYRKATEGDLTLFDKVLNARISRSLDGRRASVSCMGKTTEMEIAEEDHGIRSV